MTGCDDGAEHRFRVMCRYLHYIFFKVFSNQPAHLSIDGESLTEFTCARSSSVVFRLAYVPCASAPLFKPELIKKGRPSRSLVGS